MPVKCFNKPNRSQRRTWTAKTAGQAVCYAVAAGYSASELRQAFAECVPCSETRRRSSAAEAALAAFQRTNQVLDLFGVIIQAVQTITRSVQFVSRFLPQTRPVTLLLIPIERRLGTITTEIRVSRAANDAAITALRLAA